MSGGSTTSDGTQLGVTSDDDETGCHFGRLTPACTSTNGSIVTEVSCSCNLGSCADRNCNPGPGNGLTCLVGQRCQAETSECLAAFEVAPMDYSYTLVAEYGPTAQASAFEAVALTESAAFAANLQTAALVVDGLNAVVSEYSVLVTAIPPPAPAPPPPCKVKSTTVCSCDDSFGPPAMHGVQIMLHSSGDESLVGRMQVHRISSLSSPCDCVSVPAIFSLSVTLIACCSLLLSEKLLH